MKAGRDTIRHEFDAGAKVLPYPVPQLRRFSEVSGRDVAYPMFSLPHSLELKKGGIFSFGFHWCTSPILLIIWPARDGWYYGRKGLSRIVFMSCNARTDRPSKFYADLGPQKNAAVWTEYCEDRISKRQNVFLPSNIGSLWSLCTSQISRVWLVSTTN